MTWTAPRTWVVGETVTTAMMNTHVRDNLLLLKTKIADDGWPLCGVKTFAYLSGQSNAGGGGDTQLTNFDVTLGASLLAGPGDCVVIDSLWSLQSTAGTFTGKVQVANGSLGTLVTLFSVTSVNTLVYCRVVIKRRTSTTGAVTGVVYTGAVSGGAPAAGIIHTPISSVDWTIAQTLQHFAAHATAGQCLLAYLNVQAYPAVATALV